ncbi:conserved hypothetical protein [Candida dubliniensis CD36]|uniref:Uncharacterized protein n=1 Tax=Candida dubliniensis (strain CD36 / ATCC MYA-646 / CBS 7987 / NCPF 3949 / NRRL Y-17841) TaxID=573826 RepID=B9WJ05_CANDC|nr:conserved hypothetical protein [Candida dubliniensis CD36]CAX41224.1 conserved hypothetical protein [Candida dubliniensis CD36]
MSFSISYILEMIQLSILFVFEQLRKITIPNPERYTPQIESNKMATPLSLPTTNTSIDEGVYDQNNFVSTVILYACIVVVFSVGLISVLKREPHRLPEIELQVQLPPSTASSIMMSSPSSSLVAPIPEPLTRNPKFETILPETFEFPPLERTPSITSSNYSLNSTIDTTRDFKYTYRGDSPALHLLNFSANSPSRSTIVSQVVSEETVNASFTTSDSSSDSLRRLKT